MPILKPDEIAESAWDDRDNVAEWVVREDGTPITDLSDVTRVVVRVGATDLDSAVLGATVIWWTDSVTDKALSDGTTYTGDVIRAKLGKGTLTAGTYSACQVIVYDGTNTDGVVVSDKLVVTVSDST